MDENSVVEGVFEKMTDALKRLPQTKMESFYRRTASVDIQLWSITYIIPPYSIDKIIEIIKNLFEIKKLISAKLVTHV